MGGTRLVHQIQLEFLMFTVVIGFPSLSSVGKELGDIDPSKEREMSVQRKIEIKDVNLSS